MNSENAEQSRPNLLGRRAQTLAELALIVALLVAGANVFFTQTLIAGDAMSPAFVTGERVLGLKLPYLLAPPQRGDLAIMQEPSAQKALVARRVIGLPGERITVRGRQTLVNDVVLNEPYLAPPSSGETINFTGEYRLGNDEYLMLSDSRETQLGFGDSRSWGAVTSNRIYGRAFVVFWPLSQIRLAQQVNYTQELPAK